MVSCSAMNIFVLFEKISNSNLREDVVSMLIVIALIRPLMIKALLKTVIAYLVIDNRFDVYLCVLCILLCSLLICQ
jgi:hypothetical protein